MVLGRGSGVSTHGFEKIIQVTKTIVQKEGTNWAVGIVGDTKREVERRYFYFWNNKATDGELFW